MSQNTSRIKIIIGRLIILTDYFIGEKLTGSIIFWVSTLAATKLTAWALPNFAPKFFNDHKEIFNIGAMMDPFSLLPALLGLVLIYLIIGANFLATCHNKNNSKNETNKENPPESDTARLNKHSFFINMHIEIYFALLHISCANIVLSLMTEKTEIPSRWLLLCGALVVIGILVKAIASRRNS